MTAGFLWVWYWDPTLLTFIALMGLVLTLVDYVGPKIINQVSGKIVLLHVEKNALLLLVHCFYCLSQVYGNSTWTGAKEQKFDQVCGEIVGAIENVEEAFR